MDTLYKEKVNRLSTIQRRREKGLTLMLEKNKGNNNRFVKNKQSYHDDVVKTGNQGIEATPEGGKTVTMKIVGAKY